MQWMTDRENTDLLGIHHTANGRSTDTQKAYDRLVEEGEGKLTSYSIVILLDWKNKKATVKNMPWDRIKVTNHAFGVSLHSIGISVDANFETDPWEPWIEDALVSTIIAVFTEKKKDGSLRWPDLSVARIFGHSDLVKFDKRNATACPGKNLRAALPKIKKRVEDSLRKMGAHR
jgi:hypothetical protein